MTMLGTERTGGELKIENESGKTADLSAREGTTSPGNGSTPVHLKKKVVRIEGET